MDCAAVDRRDLAVDAELLTARLQSLWLNTLGTKRHT